MIAKIPDFVSGQPGFMVAVGWAAPVYLCYAAFGGLLGLRSRSDRVDNREPERTAAAHPAFH